MKQVLVNYMVKPEMVDENISLIKDVFAALHAAKIKGIKYSAFRMGTNVFVHVAQFETPEADKEFSSLEAFKAFRTDIAMRQLERPVTNEIEEIGSFSAMVRL